MVKPNDVIAVVFCLLFLLVALLSYLIIRLVRLARRSQSTTSTSSQYFESDSSPGHQYVNVSNMPPGGRDDGGAINVPPPADDIGAGRSGNINVPPVGA